MLPLRIKRDESKSVAFLQKNSCKKVEKAKRSDSGLLAAFLLITFASWATYHYQFKVLPEPLNANDAGEGGFSEGEAVKHIESLTQWGPHPVGSDALDLALEYVLETAEKIKETAPSGVDVQVDFFHAKAGANSQLGGIHSGKTHAYSNLKHVILRIHPENATEAEENAILVSAHVDTVFAAPGAGDDTSPVAVMLELARGMSHSDEGFKNSVIFLFNTGEEEGLDGSHSFITQHPWSSTIRLAINLEAMGIGGKSSIFQAGPNSWAVENFAKVAKYPSGLITAQDVFSAGFIQSSTDFQVYKDIAGLSGLDFLYLDDAAVYHTKNDKLKLLKPGSLQHLGENLLPFLLHAASSELPNAKEMEADEGDHPIYFDILGTYMVVYHQSFAAMLQNSVIFLSLLIWATSLLIGGYPAIVSFGLSCLSIVLVWAFSIIFSLAVALILPLISSSSIPPFVASPGLVIGLYAAPAFLGALAGQHVGYLILQAYLSHISFEKNQWQFNLPQTDVIKLEAERWLFKAGFIQWLVLLIIGTYYQVGSSYLAVVWLVSPAFAYGLFEVTSGSVQSPRPLKIVTLLVGLFLPIALSAPVFIRLISILIGYTVRLIGNPGSSPEWIGTVLVAALIAIIVCLTMVYPLSYVHFSGTKLSLILVASILLGLSLIATLLGIVPPFTEDTARDVNVVHVVDTMGNYSGNQDPSSYISLYSMTPGELNNDAEEMNEEFVCGRDKYIDFVTFSVQYGCWSYNDSESGWNSSDIPTLDVVNDTGGDDRVTQILFDAKSSTRWALAINTSEIEDVTLEGAENSELLIPRGNLSSTDGWHIIQFAGGKNSPTRFYLTLYWFQNYSSLNMQQEDDQRQLLRLRTDLPIVTPATERVLSKMPLWWSLYGKSTSPFTLSFLSSMPVTF